jgi:Tfp pilus assembly protein PilX
MPTLPVPGRDQRGVALVMALLVLVVVSILAVVLLASINVESKIAGHSRRASNALYTAEAGVAEAMSRIGSGDIPNSLNPRMVAQIFLAPAGSVPVLGTDSLPLATAQPAGQWLRYSTANKSSQVLTVQYKTDPAQTLIYKYDGAKNPAVQTASGQPIFVITSTGTRGSAQKRVVAEVFQRPVSTQIKAALAADVFIDLNGNLDACGFNHRADTPPMTKGRPPCDSWEVGSLDLPGAWGSDKVKIVGSAGVNGSPVPYSEFQSGFYADPGVALGMSQAEFFSWVGPPLPVGPPNPQGIFYLDDNAITRDKSGSFAYNDGNGEGMLYVDGDLTLNGNFTYRGVIFVEGDLKINGTAWVLGAVIAKGRTIIKLTTGNCTMLYSAEAISQALTKFADQLVTLSWREAP